MKLLAIETSTDACSVALCADDTLRERHEIAPRRHGELLLGMVDELMAEAGLKAAALDGVALGRGPGSFTGIRLGAGVVQGIAFGAQLPVACVSSLAALACAADATRVCCVQDARMGEVYAAAFECSGGQWSERVAERVCLPAALPPLPGDGWLGAGSGFQVYAAELRRRLGAGLERTDAALRYPRARDVLVLGAAILAAGGGVEAAQALPVYLRDRVVAPPKRS